MLHQLLAMPGVDERHAVGSRVGFCALHGGLEEGTAELAEAAARASGASCYAVVQPPGFRWHVPSHRYDPGHSEALRAFLAHVDVVVSLHGFGGVRGADDRWTTALLGGSNRALAHELHGRLRGALGRYRWIADLEVIPRHLRGLHPANPVNRAPSGGVQVELPPRIRRPGTDFDALVSVLAATAEDARRRCSGAAGSVRGSRPAR
jgi:phage replication-related protein YjqB (UPF0714/DUF867 family)